MDQHWFSYLHDHGGPSYYHTSHPWSTFHFNSNTPLDAIPFALMSLFIVINTAIAVFVLALFFKQTQGLSITMETAIQAGLFDFFSLGQFQVTLWWVSGTIRPVTDRCKTCLS